MAERTNINAKILVVDDEPNVLRMVSYTLHAEGFEVIVAQNGADAIHKAQTESPNLILLDVMLPDISGLEVCKQLRMKPETVNLPIIMLSALSQVPDKIVGLESGADEYITKPISPGELIARIKALLIRYQHVHPSISKQPGKVLGFIGAKGGVGTTTIALNVAAALVKPQKKVVAAEIRSSYGTFSAQLNLIQPQGIANLLALDPGKINEREVNLHLTTLPFGLRILVGPQCVSDYRCIESQQVENIISILISMVDYVVLDLPCYPSAANQTALRQCDLIALVLEPEITTLASSLKMLEQMKFWGVYGNHVGVIVVNRVPLTIPVKLDQLRSTLACDLFGVIPSAAEALIIAQRVGIPIFLHQPESGISKAISETMRKISEITG
jgi:DNA-binding response OmpR family regulator